MVPTIASRLRNLIKSMHEVLLPALDPDHAIAQEQGKLVLGSLHLILSQIDFAHAYEVVEARAMSAHARDLATTLERDPAALNLVHQIRRDLQAQLAAIENPLTPLCELQAENSRLREHLHALITAAQASTDLALRRAVERKVLEFGEHQLARERSWVAATNFDPPGSLPTISAVLKLPTTQ